MENRNTPVIPLPNEGEGGAVFPGEESGATPVIPLPNPGEGGAVNPGTDTSSGTPIVIQPLPGTGSFVPIPQQLASARFLNAACGYPALSLYIGTLPAAGPLEAGSLSPFVQFASGRQTVTITDSSGYIYLQTRLRFDAGERSTLVVLLRTGGLELTRISEA